MKLLLVRTVFGCFYTLGPNMVFVYVSKYMQTENDIEYMVYGILYMVYGSFYKLGVLFWGTYVRDPTILGPYSVPLIFGSSHI